ncbi:Ti-type conjugative transfer relaxase TraA [Achromobacter pestifer]
MARSKGRSSTAAAAYRAGVCITDERTGEVHDYTRKGGVAHSEIVLPSKACEELKRLADMTRSDSAKDRSKGQASFWNENEKAHKRGDATVAREIEVDLPHELSADDRKQLAVEFGTELAERYGVGVQVSIHEPRVISDDEFAEKPNQFHVVDPETGQRHNGNWHVHLLLTTQDIGEKGFGKKVRALDPTASRFDGGVQAVEWTRPRWEEKVQQKLNERGVDKLYTTRNKEDTRAFLIERGQYDLAATIGEATKHLGVAASAMERRGERSELGDQNRAIKEENAKYADRADLAESVLAHLTSRNSTFTDRDIYRQICKQANEQLGDQLHEAVAQLIARDEVIFLGNDDRGNAVLTTRQMQELERTMLEGSAARRGEGKHPVDMSRVAQIAAKHGLTEEQADAMCHLSGADGVSLVVGMAGTGKSTMMKAAKEVWREAGYKVRGAALAGKAADGLEEGSGIKSQTVHSLLLALDKGRIKLDSKTILCVDEAGMLSSNLTSRLAVHANRAGAKLAMIGDDRQLQPIEAGGAFKALKDELGAAKLTQIFRQRDEWARDAVHAFADGDSGKAIAAYAERGLVGVGADADDTKTRLVADWNSQRVDDGRTSIILAGMRKDVRDLNELARAERVQAGEIEPGETVQTEQGKRDFAKGDRILFLKNDKRVGVKNGQLGTIEKIEREGGGHLLTVRRDSGEQVAFNTADYDRVDHGYATTVHKAQGVTVDRAYVLTGKMHDRELSYVSMSRSRQETRLYVDASKYKLAAAVAQQMDRSNQKGTSLDAAKPSELTKADVVGAVLAKSKPADWSRYRGSLADQKGRSAPNGGQVKPGQGLEPPAQPAAEESGEKAGAERRVAPRLDSLPAYVPVRERRAAVEAEKGQAKADQAAQEPAAPSQADKAQEAPKQADKATQAPEARRQADRRQDFGPMPTQPNQEMVELVAIGRSVKAFRADRDAKFREEHGERPQEREGMLGFASRRQAAVWDKAYDEGVTQKAEAREEFLKSDDPKAQAFRSNAWDVAVQKYDTEVSAYMAHITNTPQERKMADQENTSQGGASVESHQAEPANPAEQPNRADDKAHDARAQERAEREEKLREMLERQKARDQAHEAKQQERERDDGLEL